MDLISVDTHAAPLNIYTGITRVLQHAIHLWSSQLQAQLQASIVSTTANQLSTSIGMALALHHVTSL